MKKKHSIYIIILLLFAFLVQLSSCSKDWLDKKPRDSQVVPTSISDAQALLDDNTRLNTIYSTGEISSDNYEISYSTWLSLSVPAWKNLYTWNVNIWEGANQLDWNQYYRQVFVSNVALEALNKISPNPSDVAGFNTAKGHALFYRAITNYELAILYAKPYLINLPNDNELGIPLRLTADINDPSKRSTVQETYDQIIFDLKAAIPLLPNTPLFTTRPCKSAAYGLLARTFLLMGNYSNAELYADSSLMQKNDLIDFNLLSTTSTTPISRNNAETIYFSYLANTGVLTAANVIIPSSIYQLYSSNDLRKDIYFYNLNGKLTRKGSYTGDAVSFGGLAVDEQYLIRAEARARLGRTAEAMNDLNTLLVKRYKAGTFTRITVANADEALATILIERRKELVFRGLRWPDLRRLNQDSRFAVTLSRTLNGVTYTLPPNDRRYTFALPEVEIRAFGMPQNER